MAASPWKEPAASTPGALQSEAGAHARENSKRSARTTPGNTSLLLPQMVAWKPTAMHLLAMQRTGCTQCVRKRHCAT